MFTIPITTNKPVNFISFSIVLLVIMGLCICIAPDTAYAVNQEPSLPPADAFAPALQLPIPEPPSGDGQAWVAISNGTQVRVFYLFMQHAGVEGDAIIAGSSFSDGFRLSDVNVSGKTITFNIGMPADLTYYYSVSKWDSESTKFVNVEINQAASGQNNRTFSTGYTPTYIAFGGNISYSESLSIKSFVPIFSDNGYNELLQLEIEAAAISDSLVKLRANVGLITDDVDTLRQQTNTSLTALRENLALVVDDVDSMNTTLDSLRSETDASLQALRSNIGLIKDDVDTIRVQTHNDLTLIREDVDTIRVQTNNALSAIQSDVSLIRQDVVSSLTSIYSSVGNIETDMGSMLEIIQGFEENFDSLTNAMSSLESSLSSIADQMSSLADEMAELTAAIEAETEIWENSKTEYNYDSVDDHSVSAFGKLWDWLINPFMSLFASSAPNGEISYDVESLDPESVVTRQISVGHYFQDVFFNPDTVDPSYPDLGDIDFGGLP